MAPGAWKDHPKAAEAFMQRLAVQLDVLSCNRAISACGAGGGWALALSVAEAMVEAWSVKERWLNVLCFVNVFIFILSFVEGWGRTQCHLNPSLSMDDWLSANKEYFYFKLIFHFFL